MSNESKLYPFMEMELTYGSPTEKQAKESFADSIEKEFEGTEPTSEIEQGVRTHIIAEQRKAINYELDLSKSNTFQKL